MAIATGAIVNDLMPTRLYLQGKWSLDEFEVLFRSFNDIYRLIAEFTVKAGSVTSFVHVSIPFHRGRLNRVAREQGIPPLRVLRFNYSSPGHLDLLGLGKVAEVTKDALFGIADRIIGSEDRELDRDRKLLENVSLQAQTTREITDSDLKRTHDAELRDLEVAERRVANERAAVALTAEKLEAAAKGLDVFSKILTIARENGASEEDISRMLSGFVAKVEPIIPLILGGKLLAEPSSDSRDNR